MLERMSVTVSVFQAAVPWKEIGITVSQSLSHGLWEHTVLIKCVWKRVFPLTRKDTTAGRKNRASSSSVTARLMLVKTKEMKSLGN